MGGQEPLAKSKELERRERVPDCNRAQLPQDSRGECSSLVASGKQPGKSSGLDPGFELVLVTRLGVCMCVSACVCVLKNIFAMNYLPKTKAGKF